MSASWRDPGSPFVARDQCVRVIPLGVTLAKEGGATVAAADIACGKVRSRCEVTQVIVDRTTWYIPESVPAEQACTPQFIMWKKRSCIAECMRRIAMNKVQ
ncbi:hypothetical protein Y032_0045g1194 [Ancylostoma ceylanicum]|uniref:Uncharacterized protein n=1 Tax=Ancylostoma ceylanicum TaxID=53326 RepID=A0A016UDJ2_9BILA|nr:hypothetical protein Y032_0045g1194 [Ancylostoma ceylanicum]